MYVHYHKSYKDRCVCVCGGGGGGQGGVFAPLGGVQLAGSGCTNVVSQLVAALFGYQDHMKVRSS
jgi:hypothetical protein